MKFTGTGSPVEMFSALYLFSVILRCIVKRGMRWLMEHILLWYVITILKVISGYTVVFGWIDDNRVCSVYGKFWEIVIK